MENLIIAIIGFIVGIYLLYSSYKSIKKEKQDIGGVSVQGIIFGITLIIGAFIAMVKYLKEIF